VAPASSGVFDYDAALVRTCGLTASPASLETVPDAVTGLNMRSAMPTSYAAHAKRSILSALTRHDLVLVARIGIKLWQVSRQRKVGT
jgi:hypothetical protein